MDTISLQADLSLVEQWLNSRPVAVSGEVAQFLADHAFLLPLLAEAHDQIGRYFGAAPCGYSLFSNPEDGSAVPKLVLAIHPLQPPVEALAAYCAFQQTWWNANLVRACGVLMIVPEYP
ncbi:MAG: hypothetical protein M3Z04_01385 [Chloroflexota bacterium]|nr:hypothetical protein [Chloroflexota bacterium]